MAVGDVNCESCFGVWVPTKGPPLGTSGPQHWDLASKQQGCLADQLHVLHNILREQPHAARKFVPQDLSRARAYIINIMRVA